MGTSAVSSWGPYAMTARTDSTSPSAVAASTARARSPNRALPM